VQRGRGDCRRRIARCRFEQDVGTQPDFEKLLGDQEAMVLVGDGDDAGESRQSVEPAQRVLEQGKLVRQAEKLLRVMRS
jgi:hypothetical protein